MSTEFWLEYLKENRVDLYEQAVLFLEQQAKEIEKIKLEVQNTKLSLDNAQNIIAFNGILYNN